MDSNKPGIQYLKKTDSLLEDFHLLIHQKKFTEAFQKIYNIRVLHGRLLNKLNIYMQKSKKCSKKYFYLSYLNTVSTLISDKILNAESEFNELLKSNNVDLRFLENQAQNKNSSRDSDSSRDSSDSLKIDSLNIDSLKISSDTKSNKSNNLPLFNGVKSENVIRLENISKEINNNTNEFDSNKPSLMLFYNPGCPACIQTKPYWNEVVGKIKRIFGSEPLFNIIEFNLQDESTANIATLLNIEYIPTIYMIESAKKPNGQMANIVGASDDKRIIKFIGETFTKFSEN